MIWLTFDIKHPPVSGISFGSCLRKNVFHTSENDEAQSKKSVKIVYLFLESTYPEMQRKHIPSVYEYQS